MSVITMDTTDAAWNLIKIHGYLALITFAIVFPVSVLVVTLGSRWDLWLVAHISCSVLGTILFIASIAYGVVASRSIGHLVTTHQKLGVAMIVIIILALLNGLYISLRWTPTRQQTPTRDVLHWWFGRCVILASFLICFQGLVASRWEIWAYIFMIACWFLWVLAYGVMMLAIRPPPRNMVVPVQVS